MKVCLKRKKQKTGSPAAKAVKSVRFKVLNGRMNKRAEWREEALVRRVKERIQQHGGPSG
jgi:hypothetical protein